MFCGVRARCRRGLRQSQAVGRHHCAGSARRRRGSFIPSPSTACNPVRTAVRIVGYSPFLRTRKGQCRLLAQIGHVNGAAQSCFRGNSGHAGARLALVPRLLSSNGLALEGIEEFFAEPSHVVTMGIGEFDG